MEDRPKHCSNCDFAPSNIEKIARERKFDKASW